MAYKDPAKRAAYLADYYPRWIARKRQEAVERPCKIDGCTAIAAVGKRVCSKHQARINRHGDPNIVRSRWVGDEVTYFGMHGRIKRVKGAASDYPCVDCGKPASDWSYDNADPNERTERVGRRGATVHYSADLARYHPRCKRCHFEFDKKCRGLTPYRSCPTCSKTISATNMAGHRRRMHGWIPPDRASA